MHDETHPYDPTVLVDDDAEQTAFIMFGLHRNSGSSSYLIAKLNQTTMQGFAETPRRVVFLPRADGAVMANNDKSTLHKRDGIYYLSSGTAYSTAADVYGPYTFRGNTGPDRRVIDFGLTTQAHGRYFNWHDQWFHVYCEFISQNNNCVGSRGGWHAAVPATMSSGVPGVRCGVADGAEADGCADGCAPHLVGRAGGQRLPALRRHSTP